MVRYFITSRFRPLFTTHYPIAILAIPAPAMAAAAAVYNAPVHLATAGRALLLTATNPVVAVAPSVPLPNWLQTVLCNP